MSIWSRFSRTLKTAAARTFRDLFVDEAESQPAVLDEGRLFEIRARLDALLPVLAQLSIDERKAADEYKQALVDNARLDVEIQQARAAGQEERAKDLIDAQWRVRELADDREERCDQLSETRESILSEMQKLHQMLDAALESVRKQNAQQQYHQALVEIERLEKEVKKALGG